MPPRLVVVAGPSRGAQVALETEEVALGRDSSCGVCLPDATLSRRHALLFRSPDGWRIRDLGSLNGLRVNGLSTADHVLSDGDRIELGASVLVYRPESAGAEGGADELEAEVVSTIRVPVSRAVYAGPTPAPPRSRGGRRGPLLPEGREDPRPPPLREPAVRRRNDDGGPRKGAPLLRARRGRGDGRGRPRARRGERSPGGRRRPGGLRLPAGPPGGRGGGDIPYLADRLGD
ncbi:MAG: FHA domain-containing protein, partial [Thermoanaerobaculia bacterium]|nr:FHA domain-containing protein [Thermoanaerobaculia bacterium]